MLPLRMTLKEGDFVRIHFTGFTADDNEVFDTTKEEVAKQHGLETGNVDFAPLVACVGKGHLLKGLDDALVGKKCPSTFRITLAPEHAFGKKKADHIKLMPLKVFHKQGIQPQPGLDVTIDGVRGRVKSISGNRVVVDFNNPLSGRAVEYEVDVLEVVDDVTEQAKTVVSRLLRFDAPVTVQEQQATVTLPFELPKEIQETITKEVVDSTPITSVHFEKAKA